MSYSFYNFSPFKDFHVENDEKWPKNFLIAASKSDNPPEVDDDTIDSVLSLLPIQCATAIIIYYKYGYESPFGGYSRIGRKDRDTGIEAIRRSVTLNRMLFDKDYKNNINLINIIPISFVCARINPRMCHAILYHANRLSYYCIEDFLRLGKKEILKLRNIGPATYNAIIDFISDSDVIREFNDNVTRHYNMIRFMKGFSNCINFLAFSRDIHDFFDIELNHYYKDVTRAISENYLTP